MGISIALYNSKSTTHNEKLISIGEGLVYDVFENIKDNLSLNFYKRLGEIGWGFEYGFQQGFFEGNSDEFLMYIDRKYILFLVYKKPNSLNLFDVVLGYFFIF